MKQLNILCSAVAAGQVEQVIPLGTITLCDKWHSKCKKRIKADDLLQWHHGNVTTPDGITVPGFAFWADTLTTVVNGYTYRHRELCLCRPDDGRSYAVPMSMVERKFKLPDIELADDELEAYRYIADRISPKPNEITSTVNHPAKTAIKNNGCEWKDKSLD